MDKKAQNLKNKGKKVEVELLELTYLKKHRSYKYTKLFFRAKAKKRALASKKVS